jgi:hypothetical protein
MQVIPTIIDPQKTGGMALVMHSHIEIDHGIEHTACSDKLVDELSLGFTLRCIKAPSTIFEECGRGLQSEALSLCNFRLALVPLGGTALYAASLSKRSLVTVTLVLLL